MRIFVTVLMVLASFSIGAEPLVAGPAEHYLAKRDGLSLNDASRRLDMRMETGRVVHGIIEEFRSRCAGFDYSEGPMIVRFRLTGAASEPARKVSTPAGLIVLKFESGAHHSISDLQSVVKSGRLNKIFPEASGVGVDPRSAEIYVRIRDDGTIRAYKQEERSISNLLGVPLRIDRTQANAVPAAGQPVRAGGRAINNSSFCTFGFRAVAEDGSAGYITAGHCPDVLRYESIPGSGDVVSVNLPVDGARKRWDAGHDVQWHPVPAPLDATWTIFSRYGYAPSSLPEPFPDLVEGWENLLILCHLGTRTGWSCGTLRATNHMPENKSCNHQPCTNDWLLFTPDDELQDLRCEGGDSGGPIVTNTNIPIGIVSAAEFTGPQAGQCDAVIGMSLSKVKAGIGVVVK